MVTKEDLIEFEDDIAKSFNNKEIEQQRFKTPSGACQK